MPTPASVQALQGLRDLSMLKWYVIPLLVIVAYIYTMEIKKARESGVWDAVLAGMTLFGMDFFNETWNGWVFHLTQYSAFWTTPGDTALRTTVGWNIEIMFMFSILGIVYYHSLLPDKETKILGIPNRWFWAVVFAAVCVFIECVLNYGGHLVWEYPWWNRTFTGIWLIFVFGYFEFFVAIIFMLNRKTMRGKLTAIGVIYAVPIVMNIIGLGILGFTY
jgi:hypothetical protein